MGILWLFNTCGLIVGPAIMLAGLMALAMCLRASRRSTPRRARRIAAIMSLLPLFVAFLGVIFGFIVWQSAGQPGTAEALQALGKVCLAGLVVSLLPLTWSLLLLRRQRGITAS